MGNDKEMTLRMRIEANARQAIAQVRALDHEIQRFSGGLKAFGSTAGATFSAVGTGVGLVLKPLEVAVKAAATLTAGLAALGGAALKAAADDQELVDRLSMVYGSADEAKKKFEELERIGRTSPFPVEELVNASIVLKQYGMDGRRELGAVANAARVTKTAVGDMAMMISAMQVRGLKKFGIEVDEKDGVFLIKWKDRMGKMQALVKAGADEARKALVDVMAMKGGTGFSPRTFNEFVSMLKNNIDQVFAGFGTPLLEGATAFVDKLAKGLTELIESGKLEKWGKAAADWLIAAFAWGSVVAKDIAEIFRGLTENGNFGQALNVLMTAAGTTIAVALGNYIATMGDVFAAIGKIIASAFYDELVALIPGIMKLAGKVPGGIEGGTKAFMSSWNQNPVDRLKSTWKGVQQGAEEGGSTSAGLGEFLTYGLRAKSVENRRALWNSAMDNMRTGVERMGPETMGAVGNIWTDAGKQLRGISGTPASKPFAERVEAERKSIMISIQNLSVNANDTEQMSRELLQSAALPSLSVAGN